jgi:hypothetical protein
MRVSTMREVDSVRVADLVIRAKENIGQDDAIPHMGYMMLPDYKPNYAYKYYNVRSRHLRVHEVFFVAHDGEYGQIDGVISFADIERRKGYIRVLALGQALVEGTNGYNLVWFMQNALRELSRFVELETIRLLVAKQGQSEELIGPHVSPAFLGQFEQCGFRQLTRLEKEGGRDIHVEIYECPVPSVA